MAERTEIEEKVAEVLGLSLAAQITTKKVAGLLEEHADAQTPSRARRPRASQRGA